MRSVSTRLTGILLVALGVWGGLVPFVGHYFHFALGPDKSWDWTSGRLYLNVLPAVATVLGGLNLMSAGPRRSARLGALLALAGGIWFAIGPEISQLWHAGGAQGAGHGSPHRQMLEMLTYHTGLGVVVTALAAYAFPRFPVVEEAVAPGRGRVGAATAGAGAGAAAGAVAARHGDRWYDEPGALDAPVSQRERAAAHEDELQHGDGARREHVGEGAALGAGAVGAAAVAHHEHDKHLAEREQAAQDGAGREPVAGDAAGRDGAVAGEPGAGEAVAAQRTGAERDLTGEPIAGQRDVAGEPVARERDVAGEPVAGERDAAREPVADGRDVAGEPVADATQETRVHDGATPSTAGAAGQEATAATPQSADAPTGATTAYPSTGHSQMRRRRGGLLGSLLRR